MVAEDHFVKRILGAQQAAGVTELVVKMMESWVCGERLCGEPHSLRRRQVECEDVVLGRVVDVHDSPLAVEVIAKDSERLVFHVVFDLAE